MVNGNNIFISLDSTAAPFAATRANEIQTECGLIEISSPTVGDWRQYITGRKEWSFTVSWLVGNITDIANLLSVGTTPTIHIYGRVGSTITEKLTGQAICTQAKITATRGNIAQGSFSFKGNGQLSVPE